MVIAQCDDHVHDRGRDGEHGDDHDRVGDANVSPPDIPCPKPVANIKSENMLWFKNSTASISRQYLKSITEGNLEKISSRR